jgi:uncharacterized protein involved in copper resistance
VAPIPESSGASPGIGAIVLWVTEAQYRDVRSTYRRIMKKLLFASLLTAGLMVAQNTPTTAQSTDTTNSTTTKTKKHKKSGNMDQNASSDTNATTTKKHSKKSKTTSTENSSTSTSPKN